ncbi:aldehyde dehydrogenase [Paraglaciecola arctica]|uniref:Betaine aldehyde dehydrogenase n=1 Tax=Paraglaciecola arctica BSs20135 TaxID=493475 RepID=K6XEK5_9ALTE|nr:aldehyde dehydrogenase [Paraglaciecola arctica]GAC19074.1 betaine aldehyde dehydrogenase [Paraglaciecola arctica BSs20135]
MFDNKILVGGEWKRGTGELIKSINPANGELITEFNGASLEDVDIAVAAGKRAMYEPTWYDLKPHKRAAILNNIATLIRRDADKLAKLQMLDTGKCLSETKALVQSAADTFQYTAAALEIQEGELPPSRGDFFTMSVYEPMGVIAAITPWNSPIASDAQKIAPALAAGNAVVIKPAEWTSLVSLALARICLEAGLPKGLLSVLPGPGSVIGDKLVRHPDVKKVSFTGGTATGRHIAGIAAAKLMPVSLELGGKSPTIVFEDADIEHAINGILYGIFSSTGQSCIAGSRLFVAAKIYESFINKLVARCQALNVGLPDDSTTQVAPLVSFQHRDVVANYVEIAKKEGAKILCGGELLQGQPYDSGAFYPPTILSGLDNSAQTCQEEIFGPVLVVLPFDNEQNLIQQANDSVFGLACGLWTKDYKKALAFSQKIASGTVWINTYKQFSIATPFGGVKESGLGREKGRNSIQGYMQQKSLYWGLNEEPLIWANSRTK